jgi:hypothetical protein
MVKHFEKDSDSEVTALSNLNIATFLQRPEGLVFGRKEGKTGRLGVLTGFAHEHRERGHKVIAKASMKQTIQDWIAKCRAGKYQQYDPRLNRHPGRCSQHNNTGQASRVGPR